MGSGSGRLPDQRLGVGEVGGSDGGGVGGSVGSGSGRLPDQRLGVGEVGGSDGGGVGGSVGSGSGCWPGLRLGAGEGGGPAAVGASEAPWAADRAAGLARGLVQVKSVVQTGGGVGGSGDRGSGRWPGLRPGAGVGGASRRRWGRRRLGDRGSGS